MAGVENLSLDLRAALEDPEAVDDLAGELWIARGGGDSTEEQKLHDWQEAERAAKDLGKLEFLTHESG